MSSDPSKFQVNPKDLGRWQKAQELLLGGQFGSALATYSDLARRNPGVPQLWFELGNAAAGELDFTLANQAYQRVRDLAPENSNMLSSLGLQYQTLRQLDDARFCYESAVKAAPDSVDALINLAVWFEKERRLDEAWECVQTCLAKHPRDDQARYFRAVLLHRRKQYAEAESALRDLINDEPQYPYVKYAAPHLLGVVLDQLGSYGEAMIWLVKAKAIVRAITNITLLEKAYDDGDRRRRELLAGITPEMIRRWRDEPSASTESYRFAFLGGHPRSGTTLLEQILDANPAALAFDEPHSFHQEVEKKIQFKSQAKPSVQLDSLPASFRGKLRKRYVKSLLREVTARPSQSVLVDKNPSPTMSLNVWLRIFPELKVIIALRDPRDVLISCFFLNILLNATNANFLSLERTATHYADLMDVWLKMRDIGGFDWIESRYEDVVEDPEKEGRKVTEFLGVPWHPDQARSHETARRKVLYAPTYHDVTQPVYRRAVGRWKHYAEALAPVQAKLAPYCRAFGYDA